MGRGQGPGLVRRPFTCLSGRMNVGVCLEGFREMHVVLHLRMEYQIFRQGEYVLMNSLLVRQTNLIKSLVFRETN